MKISIKREQNDTSIGSAEHSISGTKLNKTMRFLGMAALALTGIAMTGCSSDDGIEDESQLPQSRTVTLTTTVSLDENSTRALDANGIKTFAAGDQIAVRYRQNSGGYTKAVSKPLPAGEYGSSATFTVTLDDPCGGNVTYIYPASMADENGEPNYAALATQDGTLETISRTLDYAKYEGNISAINGSDYPPIWALPTNAILTNQLAICKFTIKDQFGAPITSNITKLSITNSYRPAFTFTDEINTYVITPSSQSTIWVAMKPIDNNNPIEINAYDATKEYEKDVTGKSLSAGSIYPINLTMPDAPDHVDLHTRDGVRWGKTNITDPTYGVHDYFSWGGTQSQTTFTWQNYVLWNNETDKPTRYSSGDRVFFLYQENDVAFKTKGGYWKMPSPSDWGTLVGSCDWEWVDDDGNGVSGYKVINRYNPARFIFLPVGGKYTTTKEDDTYGYYWTNNVYDKDNVFNWAHCVKLDKNKPLVYNDYLTQEYRYIGMYIRPIYYEQ